MRASKDKVYEIKVTLQGIKSPVWRRLSPWAGD